MSDRYAQLRKEEEERHSEAISILDRHEKLYKKYGLSQVSEKLKVDISDSRYGCGIGYMTSISISGDKKSHIPMKLAGDIISKIEPSARYSCIVKGASRTYGEVAIHYDLKPESRSASYRDPHIRVQYRVDKDVFVEFDMSIEDLLDLRIVVPSTRAVTSSEHHYYVGMKTEQIIQQRVGYLVFNASPGTDYVAFSGGDSTLLSEKWVSRITKLICDK